MQLLHQKLTEKIIKAFYEVHRILGYGFLEKVYKNALFYELTSNGLSCEKEKQINVLYKDIIAGDYFADIVVENKVILELKVGDKILPEYEYQLMNYLRASEIEVGYVLLFGQKALYDRKIYTNDKKKFFNK
ncbi:MAG: GxxExxY protein [Ignavibacteria bacterium]|nr:GxxExxY protein [Ignavibacteria bacterium]